MKSIDAFHEFEREGWGTGRVCEEYDHHFGAVTSQSVQAMLDAAGVAAGSRVLDVCCGAGYAAAGAAERGAEVVGVDFSPAQVEMARARNPSVRFELGDGCDLPFADGSFDAVVNAIGVPHLPDPDLGLREALRVLRCGGRFAFTVYDVPERAVGFGAIVPTVQAHGNADFDIPQGPNFFLFSDPAESRRRMEAAGFVSIAFATVSQVWRVRTLDEAIAAVMEGTVRARAALRAQSPEAMARIRAALAETWAPHQREFGYELPMPVVLACATKP
jgi:SAM-dependent methyltransferase